MADGDWRLSDPLCLLTHHSNLSLLGPGPGGLSLRWWESVSLGALSTESMLSCAGHEQWDLSLNDPVALLCCLMCNVVITPVLPPSQGWRESQVGGKSQTWSWLGRLYRLLASVVLGALSPLVAGILGVPQTKPSLSRVSFF